MPHDEDYYLIAEGDMMNTYLRLLTFSIIAFLVLGCCIGALFLSQGGMMALHIFQYLIAQASIKIAEMNLSKSTGNNEGGENQYWDEEVFFMPDEELDKQD